MSQTNSYRVRELRLTDVPPVVELGNRCFNDQTLPLLHQTWGENEVLNNYTGDPEFCLVAESEQRVIGFTLGALMIPDPAKRAARAYGWLLWIAVEEDFRKRGIAAKLANQLARRFKAAGARFMLANSAAENTPAIDFFGKHGFDSRTSHVYLSRSL